MATTTETEEVLAFIDKYRGGIGLLSTGAELVDYAGKLYNVTGSTRDPKAIPDHRGVAWKKLLNRFPTFSGASCYVTDPLPDDDEESSHPEFAVGGHMTPNKSGKVATGGVSYLMPLCKWHNSTSRDETAFEHHKTKMLKLTGFMEGDSAITFALRFENPNEHTLLFLDSKTNNWEFRGLGSEEKNGMAAGALSPMFASPPAGGYAIFKREGNRFVIESSNV